MQLTMQQLAKRVTSLKKALRQSAVHDQTTPVEKNANLTAQLKQAPFPIPLKITTLRGAVLTLNSGFYLTGKKPSSVKYFTPSV